MTDTGDIRARLEEIAEELAELAMSALREALEAGRPPALERKLTRARRAVERAAGILSD